MLYVYIYILSMYVTDLHCLRHSPQVHNDHSCTESSDSTMQDLIGNMANQDKNHPNKSPKDVQTANYKNHW